MTWSLKYDCIPVFAAGLVLYTAEAVVRQNWKSSWKLFRFFAHYSSAARVKHLAYVISLRENLVLSDVEEGNNLMLTRLTPVATLIDTKQQSRQSATTSF